MRKLQNKLSRKLKLWCNSFQIMEPRKANFDLHGNIQKMWDCDMSKFMNIKSVYTIFIRKSQDIEIGRL
jgi:hypothetical protein